jgi:hypothetical protein
MGRMKRVVLVVVLAAFIVPTTANAAVPCRNKIYNDWYTDGKIASNYPHSCYVDALTHIRPDARIYSSLADDIRTAMLAAGRRANGEQVPDVVGRGFATRGSLASASGPHDLYLGRKAAQKTVIGPVDHSSSGPPLPIIVLASLALALAAAGAIGSGVKFARARRR